MTDLIELTLPIATTATEHEAVQAAVALFDAFVQGGAVVELTNFGPYGEEDQAFVLVRGYVDDTPAHLAQIPSLKSALLALPAADLLGELGVQALAEADWAEAWKRHYHPLRISQRLIISPTWEEPALKPGDQVVWLDPGMAFGTGTHPSTQTILRLLDQVLGTRMNADLRGFALQNQEETRVNPHLWPRQTEDEAVSPKISLLDVGTGSGILAIAAVKLGASHVHATDIDAKAIAIAAENARFNGVEDSISLEVGSVPDQGSYDIICANILADVLADLLLNHNLDRRLSPNGVLLLSGIIEPRRHVVDLALAARGLHISASERDGDWLALACRR